MQLIVLSLASISSVAHAAPAYDDGGFVLSAPATGNFVGGVGAPTVEWDSVNAQYVMFFESPVLAADIPADCNAYYTIGRATSPDGKVWTVDADPVMEPANEIAGSNRKCTVGQPAVVFDGTTWHMIFSQAKEKASNGQTQPGGLAYASSPDNIHWTVQSDPAVPGVAGQGLASVTMQDGVLIVVYAQNPNLMVAWRDLGHGGDWNIEAAAVVDHATVGSWAATWVFGPALTCSSGAATPFAMTFGGDDIDNKRSLAIATSADGLTWAVVSDTVLTEGTLDYSSLNHWDVLPLGADGLDLWYSKTDASTGLKAIGYAHSGDTSGAPGGRGCMDEAIDTGIIDSGGGDSGDADTDTDADTDSDSDADADANDTGGKVKVDDCGCATGGGAGGLLPSLLLGGLLVRRRR